MKGKLLFVAGLGLGYVLGARAGRKRYEQIKGAAVKVWETPGIQKQVHTAEDFAAARIGDIPGLVFAGIGKAATGIARKRRASSAARAKPAASTSTAPAEKAADKTEYETASEAVDDE